MPSTPDGAPHFAKDAFHDFVIHGDSGGREPPSSRYESGRALHPGHSRGGEAVVRLRLTAADEAGADRWR